MVLSKKSFWQYHMFEKFNQLTFKQKFYASKITFVVFLGLVRSKSSTVAKMDLKPFQLVKKNDTAVLQSPQLLETSPNIKTISRPLPSRFINVESTIFPVHFNTFINQVTRAIFQNLGASKLLAKMTNTQFHFIKNSENETKQINI
jgi:hypothetical protein